MKSHNLLKGHRRKHRVLWFKEWMNYNLFVPSVREDMAHMAGLYKFLKDSDNMDEKKVIDVKLWDEYLIFAAMFGIADEVYKQLEGLNPRILEVSNIDASTIAVSQTVIHNSYARVESHYSGGGGSSSVGGGGGGFSGGGGGGVR